MANDFEKLGGEMGEVQSRVSGAGYDRAAFDWYVEPPFAVECLIRAVQFSGVIWDPCCGGGNIPKVLRAAGYEHVIASDIVDRGFDNAFTHDFFSSEPLSIQADCIVSNPPYAELVPFIERALAVTTRAVAVLTGIRFLASQERYWLFKTAPVKQVLILSKRPSMPPGGSDVKASGGQHDYCWIVFEHGYKGPPRIDWVMPEEDAQKQARRRA